MKTNGLNKPRVLARFNTGTRVHKPKKGTGSYSRKKVKQRRINEESGEV